MKIFNSSHAAKKAKSKSFEEMKKNLQNVNIKDKRKNSIAKMNISSFSNILETTKDFIGINSFYKKDRNKKESLSVPDNIGENIYGKLGKSGFFENMLNLGAVPNKKSQSGAELIESTIRFNEAVTQYLGKDSRFNFNHAQKAGMPDFQNLSDAVKRYKNIDKNGGFVISYDIESVGGVNSGGHQQLDFISEISATVNKIGKDGKSEIVESMNTLFGITDQEYSSFKNRLEKLQNIDKKDWTSRDNVMVSRFAMFSDENIKISQDGFTHVITDTSNAKEMKSTVENALAGLERQRKLGVDQEHWIKANRQGIGLKEARAEYINDVRDLVFYGKGKKDEYKDAVTLGYNSIEFDVNMMNIATGKQGSVRAGYHLDPYAINKYAEDELGQGAFHKGIRLKDGSRAKSSYKYGKGTQDQLKHRLIGELSDAVTKQAHNAQNDEQTLFDIVRGKSFKENLFNVSGQLNEKLKNRKSQHAFSDRPGIFLNTATEGMSFSGAKNSMSFVYNPNNKKFKTFDGFEIDRDGNASKATYGFNQFGMRANALYEHELFEIDLDKAGYSDWQSMFEEHGIKNDEKFYQQYAHMKKLKVMKSTEYVDKDAYKDIVGDGKMTEPPIIFSIITDDEQIGSMIGLKVGHKNSDGTVDFIKSRVDSLELQRTVKDASGNIQIENLTTPEAGEALLRRSILKTHIDSGARDVRDNNYKKIQRLKEFKRTQGVSFSDKVSKIVSEGGVLDLSLADTLSEDIGYLLVPESINKNIVLDNYIEQIGAILDPLDEMIKSGPQPDSPVRNNYIYENVINDVLETLAFNNTAITDKARYINGGSATVGSKRDFNRIDFIADDLFPELAGRNPAKRIANESVDMVQIDLNKSDAILNAFRPKIYSKDAHNIRQGKDDIHVLLEAYKRIGADPRFEGVWGDMSEETFDRFLTDKESASTLNDIMMGKLSSFINEKRKDNSGFGLLFARTTQNPMAAMEILKDSDPTEIANLVKGSYEKYKDHRFYSPTEAVDNNSIINEIVDRYFMPFSEKELEKQIATMSEYEQTIAKAHYQVARRDSTKRAKDIINATSYGGLNLGIHGKGVDAKMILTNGASQSEINPFRYRLNNGTIDLDINGNIYSNMFAFDNSGYIQNGKVVEERFNINNHLRFSNIGEATSNKAFGPMGSVHYAIENGKDPLEMLTMNISKMNGFVAEKTNYRLHDNLNEIGLRSHLFNFNDIFAILPELEDQGIFDKIDTYNNADIKYRGMMRETIQKIREKRISGSQDLFASESNVFYQLYQPYLMGEVVGGFGKEDIAGSKEILSHLSNAVKNTQLMHGFMSISDQPYGSATAKFSKEERPPAYQRGNYHSYDRSEFEKTRRNRMKDPKDINNELYKNVKVDSAITSSTDSRYLKDRGMTNGVTLKYAQIDSYALNDLVSKGFGLDSAEDGVSSDLVKFVHERFSGMTEADAKLTAKKIADAGLSMTTYEQESVMNSRIAYDYYHGFEVQKVKARKGLSLAHENNVSQVSAIKSNPQKIYPIITKDNKVQYTLGAKIDKNDVIGEFGLNGEEKIAKNAGIVRGRFYNGDTLVSEAELNKFINSKNLKNEDDIINSLFKEFNFTYEIVNRDQKHGQKTFLSTSEKSTNLSLDFKAGSIDPRVNAILKEVGHEDLSGKVLTPEYTKTIHSMIKQSHGKAKANEVLSLIENERHIVSDAIQAFVPELKGVGVIASFETGKHNSADVSIENIFNKIRYAKLSGKEKTEMYMALTDGMALLPDGPAGQVDFTNVNNINANINKNFISDSSYKKLQELMSEGEDDIIKDGKKKVGHIGYGHFAHMHDDAGGTSYSYLDEVELRKRASELKTKLGDKTLEQVERDSLAKEMYYIDKAFNSKKNAKGVKYSSEMNSILNRRVFEEKQVSSIISRLKDAGMEEDVKSLLGNLNEGRGTNLMGESILKPITDEMLGFLKAEPGEIRLKNTKGPRHEYLREAFKNNLEMSVDKADLAYSINQGYAAMHFNSKFGIDRNGVFENKLSLSDIDNLESGSENPFANFKKIDLIDADFNDPEQILSLNIGKQADTVLNASNNPYNQSLMIKFGEGDNDYLAIGQMPVKAFDDSITATNHVKRLGALQDQIKKYQEIRPNLTDDRAEQMAKIRATVEEIKQLQKHDITAKGQLVSQFTSPRIRQSFIGKGAGMNFYEGDVTGFEDILELGAEGLAERKEMMRRRNHGRFNDMKIGGKSVLEHAAEGKYFDIMELSEQSFENMGYFNVDLMTERFANMKFNEQFSEVITAAKEGTASEEMLRSNMKKILSTTGDSFILTRYPELQEGSDNPVIGFLNESLKGNEVQTMGYTGLKANLDFDGDTLATIRVKDGNNRSYLDYEMGVDTSEALGEQVDRIKNFMTIESMSSNQHWQRKVRERVAGKERSANTFHIENKATGTIYPTALEALSADRNIDGTIFSNLIVGTEERSTEEYAKLLNKYSDQVNISIDEGNHESVAAALKESNPDNYDEVLAEYRDAYRFRRYQDANIAKSANKSIGEISVTNNKIKQIFLGTADKKDPFYNLNSKIVYDFGHWSEEGAISSKSSIEGLTPDRAKVWNDLGIKMITGEGDPQKLALEMKDWANKYVVGSIDFDKYTEESSFREVLGGMVNQDVTTARQARELLKDGNVLNQVRTYAVDSYVDGISNLRDDPHAKKKLAQLSVGKSTTGVIQGTRNMVDTGEANGQAVLSETLQTMTGSKIDTNFIFNDEKMVNDNFRRTSKSSKSSQIFENTSSKVMAKDVIIDGTEEMFAKGKGMAGTIAIGALAAGAAVMAAGYIGGRPRPADVHAMEEAEQGNSDFLMADPGVNFQGNSGGYVININANTKEDRQKAAQAIQQVIANKTNATVNMSMNINENYGNIINRDLERAIESAFS